LASTTSAVRPKVVFLGDIGRYSEDLGGSFTQGFELGDCFVKDITPAAGDHDTFGSGLYPDFGCSLRRSALDTDVGHWSRDF
jgi:hypothetical protein